MVEQKLKAIAVDDEPHSLKTLKWELSRHCPNVDLIATYTDADEAITALSHSEIDILFMDIHLQSTNGIELIRKLSPIDYHVIFVTAYDGYAIQAFDLAATHYLLKPIDGEKLKSAIQRITNLPKPSYSGQALQELIDNISIRINLTTKIPFSIQSGTEFIDAQSIIYIEGDNNYSIIHQIGNKKLLVSKTLRKVEEKLSHLSFLRIHKSYLINLNHIKRYHRTDGGFVEMDTGKRLSVSRSKKMVLNELFK